MTKTWIVQNAKTGEELGRVVRFHRNVGTTMKPVWRTWYMQEGNPSVNADVRSVIAAFLGG